MFKKYSIAVALVVGLITPFFAQAVVTSWDYTSGVLQPLTSQSAAEVQVSYVTATSNSTASTFVNASTTLHTFGTAWGNYANISGAVRIGTTTGDSDLTISALSPSIELYDEDVFETVGLQNSNGNLQLYVDDSANNVIDFLAPIDLNGFGLNSSLLPAIADTYSLGTGIVPWYDIALSDGGYIEFGAGATGIYHSTSDDSLRLGVGILKSDGNQDLILATGNVTTGNITITDGANGDITVAPSGTGEFVVDGSNAVIGSGNLVLASGNGIIDYAFGNEFLSFTGVSSAVNYLNIAQSSTGNAPSISAAGNDTNINLNLLPKGTGEVQVGGQEIIDESMLSTGLTYSAGLVTVDLGTSIDSSEITDDTITYADIADSDQTDTKCLYLEDPTADDDLQSVWSNKTANDFLITEIWAESDQTVAFDLQIDDGTPADVNGTDIAPAAGEAEDTSLSGDTTLAAGEELDLVVTSVTNTPTWVSICWTGNWVD